MHTPAIRSGSMRRHGFAITLSSIGLCAATLPLHAQGSAETPPLPEGPGKSLVSGQCTNCHALDEALSKRGTVAEWSAIVKTMTERGASITDADAAIIAAYLGQNYGPGAPPPVPPRTGVAALPEFPANEV